MAKPLTIYLIKWQSFHENTDIQCWVEIADYDNMIPDDEAQDVYLLQPAGEPATLSVIDNDENPFKVIRGQQLTIQFINSLNYNFATFAEGSDRRWGVHYFIGDNTKTIFKGWLNMDDISEPLLPYGGEVVTLTANDGLGSLRDIPLTNDDSEVPKGKYRISQLLAYCLKKTGYELELRVAFNIKQWGDVDDISTPNANNEHLFTTTYLDALSFEEEIGKLENCYDVIEKILGHEAWLFQSKGQWWIVRIDEVEQTRGLYVTSFDADGTFIGNLGEVFFNKSIGASETIRLSEEASIIKNNRPKKSVRLNYKYEYPRELPFNCKMETGGYVSDISATKKKYNPDDYILLSGAPPFSNNNNEHYIVREFDATNTQLEIDRYLEVTFPNYVGGNACIVQTYPIEVRALDKFKFSYQFRWDTNRTAGSGTITVFQCSIRLDANDGTIWFLDEDGVWYESNSTWSTNYKILNKSWDVDAVNENDWQTAEWFTEFPNELRPIPKNGRLYFMFHWENYEDFEGYKLNIKDITFEYMPNVAGLYNKYNSQYCQTDRGNTDYAANIEEDVFVSDSIDLLTKGSLLKIEQYNTVFSGSVTFTALNSFSVSGIYTHKFFVGQILKISNTTNNNFTEARVTAVAYSLIGGTTTVFVDKTTTVETDATTTIEEPVYDIASEFYNAAVFPTGAPGTEYNQRYGRIQLFDVWNQHYYDMRAVEGTLQGLDLSEVDGDDLPDAASMLNKWEFTDNSVNLADRYWVLLSYEQNHDNAGWTGYFREVFNTNREKDYSNFEFKYLEK